MEPLCIFEVTTIAFGIQLADGTVDQIIPRYCTIPGKKSKTYTTSADSRNSVVIKVFHGQRLFAADNYQIGQLRLEGFYRAKRGVARI